MPRWMVLDSMICLVETVRDVDNVRSEQFVFYEKLKRKREKQSSNQAMHDDFVHTDTYIKHFFRMKRL